MRTQLVPMILQHVSAEGKDAAGLIRRFGLPSDGRSEEPVMLPLQTIYEVCEAAEDVTGDPFFGLHMALSKKRGTYGILEFAVRSAPTMHAAFERLVRFQRLISDTASFSSYTNPGSVVIDHRVPGVWKGLGRHGNEFSIVMLLRVAREMTGAATVPRRVWFAHPEPKNASELLAFLGTDRVDFGCGTNGMSLEAGLLQQPVVSADPELLPVLDRCAETLLPPSIPAVDPLSRLREQIRHATRNGSPTLAKVAASLHMSPRTLQRRTEELGQSFHEILEEVRRGLAFEALADATISLEQVAYEAGYAHPRAFLRAFKRWTGVTPQHYRQRHM